MGARRSGTAAAAARDEARRRRAMKRFTKRCAWDGTRGGRGTRRGTKKAKRCENQRDAKTAPARSGRAASQPASAARAARCWRSTERAKQCGRPVQPQAPTHAPTHPRTQQDDTAGPCSGERARTHTTHTHRDTQPDRTAGRAPRTGSVPEASEPAGRATRRAERRARTAQVRGLWEEKAALEAEVVALTQLLRLSFSF